MSMEIALEWIRKNKETKEKELNLSKLSLTHLPEELRDCEWLEHLNIRENKELKDLSPLSRLVNLQSLYCSFMQVSDLSPLSGLVNLQRLSCYSTQVSDLSPLSIFIEKGIKIKFDGQSYTEGFDFKDCPLTFPPLEIAQQGNAAILKYFAEQKNKAPKNSTKPKSW